MHAPNDAPTTETLHRERTWLRRLAHALARDAADADDLVQDAWLAFLRRPPRETGALRAWLRRVLRHRRIDQSGRADRARRHALRTAERDVPATVDVVARAEARGRVGRAVLALPEPYRTTVLLRYEEDLPPRAIAERTSVPVETVRTRLKRAHALLRDALASDAPDAPPAWLLLLDLERSGTARVTSSGVPLPAAMGLALVGAATAVTAIALQGRARSRRASGARPRRAPPSAPRASDGSARAGGRRRRATT
jgi:RNA polymerase sigma-70 factor (ECF subfamily)